MGSSHSAASAVLGVRLRVPRTPPERTPTARSRAAGVAVPTFLPPSASGRTYEATIGMNRVFRRASLRPWPTSPFARAPEIDGRGRCGSLDSMAAASRRRGPCFSRTYFSTRSTARRRLTGGQQYRLEKVLFCPTTLIPRPRGRAIYIPLFPDLTIASLLARPKPIPKTPIPFRASLHSTAATQPHSPGPTTHPSLHCSLHAPFSTSCREALRDLILPLRSPTGRSNGKSTARSSCAKSKYQPKMQRTKTKAPAVWAGQLVSRTFVEEGGERDSRENVRSPASRRRPCRPRRPSSRRPPAAAARRRGRRR